ncbi:MAG: hypothetical protein GC156_11725 [Actinomycetales bacterium]|nr:hypothetical protein [Actinomycetales bacterium]
MFDLDLHISVIEDLKPALASRGVDILHWSISGHNHILRGRHRGPDPVSVVNARTWRDLNENLIDQFQDRYQRLLAACDGFIACYSPAFAELYRGLDKPILVVSATRYEAPYSSQPSQWARLNQFLADETSAGRLVLAANNRGDIDYLRWFTGVTPLYSPSLCTYTAMSWQGGHGPRVIFARDAALSATITRESGGTWKPVADVLGMPYSWAALSRCSEVLVVPYNISTMSLFELATAGVPVTVPSRQLLLEWAKSHAGVLSELSFFQVERLDPSRLETDDPNNFRAPGFYDWWLDRADFYDETLMPNVRVISSLDELSEPHPLREASANRRRATLTDRNSSLLRMRKDTIEEFCRLM